MKRTKLFATETQILCEVKTWWSTKWYYWSNVYNRWIVDVNWHSFIAIMEGRDYVRSFIRNEVLKSARKIGKLEFALYTGKKLRLP